MHINITMLCTVLIFMVFWHDGRLRGRIVSLVCFFILLSKMLSSFGGGRLGDRLGSLIGV